MQQTRSMPPPKRAQSPQTPSTPTAAGIASPAVCDTNPNTSWVHRRGFRSIYVFFVFAALAFIRMSVSTSMANCWTVIVFAHSLLSFIFLHWIKGVPGNVVAMPVDENTAQLTFWEQIDDGYLGTPTRRFLAAAPIVLFLLTLVSTGDNMKLVGLNAAATLAVLVPKHESLFGVRLFGWNSD